MTMANDVPARVDLHLQLRIKPGRRAEYLEFLRTFGPVFEAPGGIEIRLLEDLNDDHRFLELILYDDEAAYARDRVRVKTDPAIIRGLEEWRSFLAEPPRSEVYRLRKF
jgi:hypothetical protein